MFPLNHHQQNLMGGEKLVQQLFRLRSEKTEKAQTGTTTFDVHHYELVFDATPAPLLMHVYADDLGGLVRVEIPSQGLDLLRDDLASAITRMRIAANPGDEAVSIPANGFNLGATGDDGLLIAATPASAATGFGQVDPLVTVRRGGQAEEIRAVEVVPGDIVLVEGGVAVRRHGQWSGLTSSGIPVAGPRPAGIAAPFGRVEASQLSALVALARGCDAVAFLDADNWFEPKHKQQKKKQH